MGLRSARAAVQLQVHVSCLARRLWHADLSFLPISQLAAAEPMSKALPTFHGSKACVQRCQARLSASLDLLVCAALCHDDLT